MSNKAVLTATVLTMAGLLATNQAYATPVTFFGEDPNATGGTPIAHPVSDATRASFLTNLSSPGTETFDSFSPGATNVAANFGDGVTAHLSGGVIQNFSSAGRFAISSPNYYETQTSSFAINFSKPIAAFGFYGTDIGDFGGVLGLTLTDTHGVVSNLVVPALEGANGSQPENGSVLYFGFYNTGDSYTSISFTNSSTTDAFGFDNFTVGVPTQVVPTPVPEPGTLALFSSAILGIVAFRRRWA